jgi:LacI family transcriptional regulator
MLGSHGRGILAGIAGWRVAANWILQMPATWSFRETPLLWPNLPLDGLVVAVHGELVERAVAARGLPCVNVSSISPQLSLPTVQCDNVACGRLAGQHLLDAGLRHFAFAGHRGVGYTEDRLAGFREVVEAAGHTVAVADHRAQADSTADQRAMISPWLAGLPRPLGMYAVNDQAGMGVLETCRTIGLHVPEDVAVIGTDNDELIVSLSTPPLTSIDTDARRIGYEAARLLDAILNGEPPLTDRILVPPRGLVPRASTDVIAVEDADVATALRFIRQHADRPIGVPDVLDRVPLSRRPLEKRFRALLGRSILDEIHRVHVDRAKTLLLSTDLTLPQVARRSGMPSLTRFNVVFRELAGTPPGEYRNKFRPLGGGWLAAVSRGREADTAPSRCRRITRECGDGSR